jgi:hypothetical protein
LFDQAHDLRFAGDIGWDSDRAAFDSRQLVEFLDSLIDALWPAGLASSDDNFLCTCAEECCRCVKTKSSRSYVGEISARFRMFSVVDSLTSCYQGDFAVEAEHAIEIMEFRHCEMDDLGKRQSEDDFRD